MNASESNVQSRVRLEAVAKGVRLFRNNVGAGTLANGNYIRWGLANDSEQLNRVLKSSDLIGWRSIVITPDMVGKRIAQFVARECKPEGWTPNDSDRTIAQRRFIDMVNADGGDAAFATTDTTL